MTTTRKTKQKTFQIKTKSGKKNAALHTKYNLQDKSIIPIVTVKNNNKKIWKLSNNKINKKIESFKKNQHEPIIFYYQAPFKFCIFT